MRILAVDHGAARAGCAACDPTETIVRPVGVVAPPELEAVRSLAHEEGAELVVVGIPVSLDGTEGEQASVAREFAATLAEAMDPVPVETYDERLTTRLASSSRQAGAAAPADALAAAHLLESFLAWRSGAAASTRGPASG